MFEKINSFHQDKAVDRTADGFEKFAEWGLI
nr:MAG TPA: hypothetical protein [Caudoviricetes sp.]